VRLKFASLLLVCGPAFAGGPACLPMPDIELRLKELARGWHEKLSHEPGYAPGPVTVCKLQSGLPFADHRRQRIYVQALAGINDEITLAHEYLHLAFSRHPRGHDEVFIETMARRLVENP
jgi:uncharacterized protein YfaQ (DUF2300 family)